MVEYPGPMKDTPKRVLMLLAATALLFTPSFLMAERTENPPMKGPITSLRDQLERDRCYAFPLMEQRDRGLLKGQDTAALLSWTTSGLIHDNRMYLAEFGFNRLVELQVGGYIKTASGPLSRDGSKLQKPVMAPWYIYPRWTSRGTYGGYVLLDLMDKSESRVLVVDRHGRVEDSLPTWGRELKKEEDGESVIIMDVLRMVPVGNGIVANADFITPEDFTEKKGRAYWNAFAYLDRGAQRDQYIPLLLEGSPVSDQKELKEKFYGRDFTYMTVINNVAYVLVMEPQPWIGQVDLKDRVIRRLPEFPEDLRVPSFSIRDGNGEMIRGTERLYTVYRAIQENALPVGLYSWKERLFVLSKSASDRRNGATEWHLVEVSSKTGEDLHNRIRLPTRAAHVALVLGEEFFGVVEKGGIEGVHVPTLPWKELYRPTRSAVVFSTELLSGKIAPKCQEIVVGP